MPLYHGIELPQEQIDKIEEGIKADRDSTRNLSRIEVFNEQKAKLAKQFPDVFEGIDLSKLKIDSMYEMIGDKTKAKPATETKPAGSQQSTQASETAEQIEARLRSKMAQENLEQQSSWRKQQTAEEIVSIALSRGLDPAYKSAFKAIAQSEYDIEVQGEAVMFKNAQGYFAKDGKHASASDVADVLLKQYNKFAVAGKSTPNLHQQGQSVVGQQQNQVAATADDKWKKGVGELSLLQTGFDQFGRNDFKGM